MYQLNEHADPNQDIKAQQEDRQRRLESFYQDVLKEMQQFGTVKRMEVLRILPGSAGTLSPLILVLMNCRFSKMKLHTFVGMSTSSSNLLPRRPRLFTVCDCDGTGAIRLAQTWLRVRAGRQLSAAHF